MTTLMSLRAYQVDRMREMSDRYHLLFINADDASDYPDCVNVCFWYVPERMREAENRGSREWEQELGKVRSHFYV